MMDGFGAFALMMMVVGMVFCFAMLAGIVWLVGYRLNRKQGSLIPDTRQERSSGYAQGYRLLPHPPETYREGGEYYQYPQPKQEYDQPQAQYPQEMPPGS